MNNSDRAKLIRHEDGQENSKVCGNAEQIAARPADSPDAAQARSLALAFRANFLNRLTRRSPEVLGHAKAGVSLQRFDSPK